MAKSFQRRVGERIQALRLEREISVEVLALAIESVRDTVYKIERGTNAPSFVTMTALAAIFGVAPLDLLTIPGTNDRHDLIELSRKVPSRVVSAMLHACEAIADDWMRAIPARRSRFK